MEFVPSPHLSPPPPHRLSAPLPLPHPPAGVCLPHRKNEYDPACTHVVLPELKRTEKVLCAMAAGKWLLSDDYLYVRHPSLRAVRGVRHPGPGGGGYRGGGMRAQTILCT